MEISRKPPNEMSIDEMYQELVSIVFDVFHKLISLNVTVNHLEISIGFDSNNLPVSFLGDSPRTRFELAILWARKVAKYKLLSQQLEKFKSISDLSLEEFFATLPIFEKILESPISINFWEDSSTLAISIASQKNNYKTFRFNPKIDLNKAINEVFIWLCGFLETKLIILERNL